MRTCWVCAGQYDHDGAFCRSAECRSEMNRRAGQVGRRPPVTEAEYVEVAGFPYLRGTASVARFLTEVRGHPVTRRQADAWRSRSARNGFPEGLTVVVGGAIRQVWDPDEVRAWGEAYQPSRGGAPRGARNGAHVRYGRRVPA